MSSSERGRSYDDAYYRGSPHAATSLGFDGLTLWYPLAVLSIAVPPVWMSVVELIELPGVVAEERAREAARTGELAMFALQGVSAISLLAIVLMGLAGRILARDERSRARPSTRLLLALGAFGSAWFALLLYAIGVESVAIGAAMVGAFGAARALSHRIHPWISGPVLSSAVFTGLLFGLGFDNGITETLFALIALPLVAAPSFGAYGCFVLLLRPQVDRRDDARRDGARLAMFALIAAALLGIHVVTLI